MPHHTEASSGSPVFSIAAADIGNGTSRVSALSVLLMQEQGCTVGFGAGGGGIVRVKTVVLTFASRSETQICRDL